ncbi:MAG TPA: prepilin-type N-terminal cleavage/methylation domain-containing protein [Tepidisphaeraceae bacterium]
MRRAKGWIANPRAAQARRLNRIDSSFIVYRSGFFSAFTLVELMISIVLVLVLMVGIGKIFQLTSNTVGGGMAISTMTRDDRAAQVTMQDDFAGAASDSPVFMICSERASAFLTPQDKKSDADGDPMTVPDASSTHVETNYSILQSAGGSALSPALYGDRNHRIDRIGFFARGTFSRQTSNDNLSYRAALGPNSNEAYIWYGHVRLPGTTNDNNNSATNPDGNANNYQTGTTTFFPHLGYKTNTNNNSVDYDSTGTDYKYYENNPIATNWVLGRVAILLEDESNFGPTPSAPYWNGGKGTEHLIANNAALAPLGYRTTIGTYLRTNGTSQSGSNADFYPLPTQLTGNNGYIYRSRYDVAGTTISGFRGIVSKLYDQQQFVSNSPQWWWSMVYDTTHPTVITSNAPSPVLPFRFECNPYVTKPLTGTQMAQTTPYFIPHVTQFIVEFAGDYLTQTDPAIPSATNNAGYITDEAPDGKIDFYYDTSADSTGIQPQLWVRKIRWYGFPRDTGGALNGGPDGMVKTPPATSVGLKNSNGYPDVLPYRDIAALAPVHDVPQNFEVPDANMVTAPSGANPDYAAYGGLSGNAHYYCVWRNSAPKLIRILMKIDDPNGRVGQGRWIEQVFAVQ